MRRRLAAVTVAVALPLAGIVAVNAVLTYRKMSETLAAAPVSAAAVSRQAIIASLVGAARYGLAAADALAPGAGLDGAGRAHDFLTRSLAHNAGYVAIRVQVGDRTHFAVRPDEAAQAAQIERALAAPPEGPPDLRASAFSGGAWLRPVSVGAARGYLVRVVAGRGAERSEAVVLVGARTLRGAIDALEDMGGARIALVDAQARSLIPETDDAGWMPGSDFRPSEVAGESAARGRGRDGRSRLYGVARLKGPQAFVVAAAPDEAERALRAQLPVSIFAPVLALGLVSLIFLRALKTNVLDWIMSLEAAARRSQDDPAARAPLSPRMPAEIVSVSRAFNAALDARDAREGALAGALDHNLALTRELHHRVKNSLQMVQSYLALGAREAQGRSRAALSSAQCRAYILSAAYRRALSMGEMRPFDLDAFLADICAYATQVLSVPGRRVDCDAATGALAGIDEAIPLGMIVVDLIEEGLRAPLLQRVVVKVLPLDSCAALVSFASDNSDFEHRPSRLRAALMRQLAAEPVEPPPGAQWAIRVSLASSAPNRGGGREPG